jgi:hypothetical protein
LGGIVTLVLYRIDCLKSGHGSPIQRYFMFIWGEVVVVWSELDGGEDEERCTDVGANLGVKFISPTGGLDEGGIRTARFLG